MLKTIIQRIGLVKIDKGEDKMDKEKILVILGILKEGGYKFNPQTLKTEKYDEYKILQGFPSAYAFVALKENDFQSYPYRNELIAIIDNFNEENNL